MSEVGESIIRGMQQAVAFAEGDKSQARLVVVEVPEKIDVRSIRKKLHMSQTRFARMFGFDLWEVRQWERHMRVPRKSERAFLKVIDRDPDLVVAIMTS